MDDGFVGGEGVDGRGCYKGVILVRGSFVLSSLLGGAAPEVGADNLCGVWMIDDKDNSFSTPSFRIRYARQDVFLAIMISFYLSYGGYEVTSTLSLCYFMYKP